MTYRIHNNSIIKDLLKLSLAERAQDLIQKYVIYNLMLIGGPQFSPILQILTSNTDAELWIGLYKNYLIFFSYVFFFFLISCEKNIRNMPV